MKSLPAPRRAGRETALARGSGCLRDLRIMADAPHACMPADQKPFWSGPDNLTIEKFFNEEPRSILMKEVINDCLATSDQGTDECNSIAESMIEEINQIALPNMPARSALGGRHKGSLRKRLIRQIREARKLAMM